MHTMVRWAYGWNSNESYRAVLSCGTVYYAVQVALTFESMDGILQNDGQMKATEQYFPVMLFIMLCKVVLTFEPVDKILNCDH